MFDRARGRNVKIWSVNGLNAIDYAGISHDMAVTESDRNSMNTGMIENLIAVVEDEETRVLARLAANLTLETDKIDQQLTLAQAGLVTERAKLALLAKEFEAKLLTLEEEYDSDVLIQYAKEAALTADRSIEIKREEVSFQTERFNLEAREVDLLVRLEEIEQEQAAVDVARAEIQVSQLKLDQTEEELKRQEVDLQLVRIDTDIAEAGVGLERALLAQDEVALDKRGLVVEALEIVYQKNVEILARSGFIFDLEDVAIERITNATSLFVETYNLAKLDIDSLSYKNDKKRFETRTDLLKLRGKEIDFRARTLAAEERELRARIVELQAETDEIAVPLKRLEMAELRAEFEKDMLEDEIDVVERREGIETREREQRSDLLQEELNNIDKRILRLDEVFIVQELHQDFREVLADLQAEEPVRIAESHETINDNDNRNEVTLVASRTAADAIDATKRIEVNAQRRTEAGQDSTASINAALIYARAVVTTNLIQSIASA